MGQANAAGRRSSTHRLLLTIAGASLLVAGSALALADARFPAPAEFGLAWGGLLVLSLAVQRIPLHLHVRDEGVTYVVSELPLVIGLFLFHPLEVVTARLAGHLLHEVLTRRHPPIKVLVNGGSYAVETAVALAVFWTWAAAPAGEAALTTVNLVLALLAVTAATVVGGLVVWAAVSVTTGSFDVVTVRHTLALVLPIALVNGSVAAIAVVIIRDVPTAAWLLAVPTVIGVLGYRRYLDERADRQVLGMLYELSRETHASQDVASTLEAVARTVREHIGAVRLELYLHRSQGSAWRLVSGPGDDVSPLRPADRLPDSIETSLTAGAPVREHDERGRCTGITYAIDLGRDRSLALVAAEPRSDVDGFRSHAESALKAVASHARLAIEDAELEEAKDSFLSSVSHELRTPLAVVLAASETLQHQSERLAPDQVLTLTERLHAQARRLDGLLRDLIDVDRLGRGMLQPSWSQVDVGRLVESCVRVLDVQTHRVLVRAHPVVAVIDPAACERIVENLVMNASKYSPAGGTIRVDLEHDHAHLTISVTDQGPGIADPDKRRVFELFTRLDESGASPGTGVGLSLVERLVRMQEGTIEVHDDESGGARFVVRLPRRERAPADQLTLVPDEPPVLLTG